MGAALTPALLGKEDVALHPERARQAKAQDSCSARRRRKPAYRARSYTIFTAPPAKNGRPNDAAPMAIPAIVGPTDWATPRTAPVIATAPARSAGGTSETT